MFNIITKDPLVGQELKLSKDNVKNWTDLTNVISDEEPHQISVVHNNKIHLGEIVRYKEGRAVKYAILMDKSVVFPSGVCIKVEIDEATEENCKPCCADKKLDISGETRFAVLDSDGCITGYVTLNDIINNIEVPTLCDLLPSREERNGTLVSQDRILTISGDCNIKAVEQSDIKCK